ncbi:MAG: hypothetical protein ISR58_06630 [Anaerolineales bacterium]|nr:hypothetical protein [Chloroflexota bacterium]MBL6980849.1 hypothetical protein [Anaerolineales bacterium]
MQITPAILKQFANTTVEKITRANYDIMSAYLRGSLVMGDDPLLGNTTDIDLVFIHTDTPRVEREILRLTDEVHLDIEHHSQREYLKGRDLRIHPWMGPTLYNAQVLYDPQHFLDFTIATVRGMFHREDHTLIRVRTLIDSARNRWISLQPIATESNQETATEYLKAIEETANAVALLVGEPLTDRRFLTTFAKRAQSFEQPGLYAGLMGLLGAPRAEVETLHDWAEVWKASFLATSISDRPIQIHSYRRDYYARAFEALLTSERPKDAMWPLLHTWNILAGCLPQSDPAYKKWQSAFEQLGLLGTDFLERIEALDIYLEQVEEKIESWAIEHGA